MSRATSVDPVYASHAAHLVGGPNKPGVVKYLSRPAPSSDVAARESTGGAAATAAATARLLARARVPLTQQPASAIESEGTAGATPTTKPTARGAAPRTTLSSSSSSFRHDAAELLKVEGNNACKNKKWKQAEKCYAEAIEKDPTYAALFSNRALARQKQGHMLLALQDAEQCVELMPQWHRGWARKAEILLECQ